jgi:hypothetical protein
MMLGRLVAVTTTSMKDFGGCHKSNKFGAKNIVRHRSSVIGHRLARIKREWKWQQINSRVNPVLN